MLNRCSVKFEAVDGTDYLLGGQGTDVYIFLDRISSNSKSVSNAIYFGQ